MSLKNIMVLILALPTILKFFAQTFTRYIAESRHQSFLNTFSKSIFYSFLMGGFTDAGNVEDELVLVQYCTQDDPSQEMGSCVRYLSLEVPVKADADGLIKCVENALQTLWVDNILDRLSVLGVKGKSILTGGGTDGALASHVLRDRCTHHTGLRHCMHTCMHTHTHKQ